jgi:2-methylcitrate dehydratase PrpD
MHLPALAPSAVRSITVRTPQASVHPLVHPMPTTGLESKFSLPYAFAAVLLDPSPGFGSFTDEAVLRPEARELMSKVVVTTTPGGNWLLDGEISVTVDLVDQPPLVRTVKMPPGSPALPASAEDLRGKVERCCPDLVDEVMGLNWGTAAQLLEDQVTG